MRGKRDRMEVFKTILIVLLSISAIVLLAMTPLVRDSGILSLLNGGQQVINTAHVTLSAAARPARIAVHDGETRRGVQYDQQAADDLFFRFGPLLGEALNSAGMPEELRERQWQNYLRSAGIYFDFVGDIPLSALASWLQQDGICTLTASARRILLVDGGGGVVQLCYEGAEDGRFYRCPTALTWELHLAPAVADVAGDEAAFAFESGKLSGLLRPYTLITEERDRKIYEASTPVTPGGDQSWLLETLDYTGRNHAQVSGGELYLDGNDRLRILNGGQVVYDAAQAGKYPVASARSGVTVAEAIETTRRMAENTVGARCGAAELYLMSAVESEKGYRIRFGYRLDGSLVWLYDEGWAAEFYVRDGCVMEFTLRFRSYLDKGESALLLSLEQSALMVPDLTRDPCELTIQYWDQGAGTVAPTWVAR